jgi:hypothetical protein
VGGTLCSLVPSDVRGAQTEVLAQVAATIPHPLLRARVGDIAFSNARKHHVAGRAATVA